MIDYVRKILEARVYDLARQTPLDHLTRVSQRLGCSVLLKREDLQPVFSFKIRGAFNGSRGSPQTNDRPASSVLLLAIMRKVFPYPPNNSGYLQRL